MKSKYTYSAILLLMTSTFSACNLLQDCTKGTGDVVEKKLSVDNFEEISLNGAYDVFISQAETQSVSIKAQENLIELLNQSVSNKQWEIEFTKCVESNKAIEIYIEVPTLTEISVNGSGSIEGKELFNSNKLALSVDGSGDISMNIEAKELTTEIDGSGDLNLSGKTKTHQIEVNGSGDVNAFDLHSAESDIEINGSGDVKVNVSYALDAEVNGSGDIYYKGSVKKINSNIEGSGRINQAD